MPNFNYTAGASFRPYTFEEMLRPLAMYTKEYNAIQEGIGELGAKADVFDKLANEQTDPKAYAMYKQYSNDLASQAESLAKQGLTPASRQGLVNMRRRYSSEIIPIEQAYKRRGELVDEQRKALQQDSTLLFDRLASTISLDELIDNPALSPQSYSGALLTKQVGTAASNLSKEMRDNPRKWRSILGNQYYETLMQKGYRPEEVLQAIQNNPNAAPELKRLVDDAVESSGIASWGDQNILNRAYDYARQGLWNAVGETQYQTLSNKAYDYAMQERLATIKKGAKAAAGKSYRAVPKTAVDGDKKTTELKKDLEYITGLMNGTNKFNEMRTRKVPIDDPFELKGTRGHLQPKGYRDEQYNYTAEQLNRLSEKYGTTNLQELSDKLSADIRSSAVRSFVYKPNITQSDLISQVIKENSRTLAGATESTGLYELEDNRKGDAIDIEDMNKYFTDDVDLSYDPEVGIILNSTDSKGKTRQMVLDPELIDDPQRNVHNMMESINALLDAGADIEAQKKIEDFMNYLDGKFNTLVKRQSNTTSK